MIWPWQNNKREFHLGLDKPGSKTFCILPWIHLHSLPNGNVIPCCVAPYEDSFGNLNESSFSELWNSDRQKELRRNMLDEKKSNSCKRCYEIEETNGYSMRQQVNDDFSHHYDLVRKTKRDGTLKKMRMYYLDLRFSNICNLKCLGCSPTLSSSWYDDYSKLYNKEHEGDKIQKLEHSRKSFWNELENILPHVERAYFAGGEPLLMPEHYKCLDFFIEREKSDIHLCYNTNFMVMDSCGKSIFSYWKKFNKVNLSISIDDIGERGEYFRFGTKWDKLIHNMKEVKKNCPHVELEVTCTVSLFNISRLPEIHSFLYENKLINEFGFFLNYLIDPHYLRSHNLSDKLKNITREKLSQYLSELKNKEPNKNWQKLESCFRDQVEFMNNNQSESSIKKFNEWIDDIDKIRGTKLIDSYPEIFSDFKHAAKMSSPRARRIGLSKPARSKITEKALIRLEEELSKSDPGHGLKGIKFTLEGMCFKS